MNFRVLVSPMKIRVLSISSGHLGHMWGRGMWGRGIAPSPLWTLAISLGFELR